jgi:tRNA pseudouridine13 synthase
MKDRQARTRQWFSVWLPGKDEPNWSGLNSETITVLQTVRHARKLKRGVLAGNRFAIRIRDFHGDAERLDAQLQTIKQNGFPNYFGGQRFGHSGYNISRALAMFAGQKAKPEQQSLYLSAARAFLFNEILARRVAAGTWHQALAGDVFKLDGSNSYFHAETIDDELLARSQRHDIHPAAALWGKGNSQATGDTKIIEDTVIAEYPELAAGLIKFGLEKDYRALRVIPNDLNWLFENPAQLYLTFTLPAGSFATALLREIITTSEH